MRENPEPGDGRARRKWFPRSVSGSVVLPAIAWITGILNPPVPSPARVRPPFENLCRGKPQCSDHRHSTCLRWPTRAVPTTAGLPVAATFSGRRTPPHGKPCDRSRRPARRIACAHREETPAVMLGRVTAQGKTWTDSRPTSSLPMPACDLADGSASCGVRASRTQAASSQRGAQTRFRQPCDTFPKCDVLLAASFKPM